PVTADHEADLGGALRWIEHVRAGTALQAALQVAAALRRLRQQAGAEQGGRRRQGEAECRRAAEEFAPTQAPERRLTAEIFQIAVHDCLTVPLCCDSSIVACCTPERASARDRPRRRVRRR